MQGLPWEKPRRSDRVGALRRDLEKGNASAEEGFSRLKAIFNEEIRLGDEVSVINAPITRKDGEVVNARILRIGNQWMVYGDEEGNKFGILQRTKSPAGIDYTWKEELSFEERQAIKLAIDVKLARKPPQLVQLPLSLALENQNSSEPSDEELTSDSLNVKK